MKTPILFLCFLLLAAAGHSATVTSTFFTNRTVTIPAGGYTVSFSVFWFGDDFPQSSAPGRIELRDAGGTLLGRVTASHYQASGVNVYSSLGSLSDVVSSMNIFAADGSPADGQLTARWHITGVPPGTYTLRFFEYTTWDNQLEATAVWTRTFFMDGAAAGTAPTIAWSSAPATVASGASYTVSAQGHDADGNLTQVNVWKNGQPFAFAGGGNGTNGTSGDTTSDTGPQTVTFTAQAVDATGATSPLISHTVNIAAPVNSPPSVTLLSPSAVTVTAGATLTISARATDADGNLSAHNLDIQRPAGDWNLQGRFATGEPFQGGPVGSAGNSTRSAAFTFTDVGTYHVRSGASDGSGWVHSATVAVTVTAPPPVQYALSTSAGPGGSVTAGGLFNAGTSVTVTAAPDASHDFASWTGDAGGSANPLAVLMDRNKTVRAVFAPKSFALVTSATTGGAVTPGGTYPPGTTITLAAVADATHRFLGWAGDASGTAPTIAVMLDAPKTVQAVFTDKATQTLVFPGPADQPVAGPPLILNASVSSGLPVHYTVLSGPATLSGNQLVITGPGAVTVQASQAGDGFYLPASSVTRTFNAYAAALMRYRLNGRTLLQSRTTSGAAPYVVESP